jgi:hypothetical protein
MRSLPPLSFLASWDFYCRAEQIRVFAWRKSLSSLYESEVSTFVFF